MKKIFCALLSFVMIFSLFTFDTFAVSEAETAPYVIDFTLSSANDFSVASNETRVSGLILTYALSIQKSGTSIVIKGKTGCSNDVVKCGFKNLTVERRKSSSSSWSDYYDYGDYYVESTLATVSTTLSVASGYQYRVTCKHYAKKNLLLTENISNASAVLTM